MPAFQPYWTSTTANISQQLLHRDWQVSNALTRRVIDCVGNRRRYRYRRQLAKALGAQGARFFIEAAYEQDIELRNIGIGWDEVTGIVSVDELARCRISFGLFQQRLAHAPDDAADRLASRRFRIDDPAGVKGGVRSLPLLVEYSHLFFHCSLQAICVPSN